MGRARFAHPSCRSGERVRLSELFGSPTAEIFTSKERLRSLRGAIFLCRGVFPMPVGTYDKKMKKSCKIGKIFFVWVLKNSYSYDIMDKN